ncbi:hypothetical protein HJB86_32195 [Rhizobium sp. NZLR3b]|uniref:hypothetical protein n=1 Tax=Rhizobium sp. NZLR3b TaxID=2731101 RepID=UPI001C83C2EB|nr:hypothetical protein [Rhizobium sp. NZLR3b]MBX5193497.1 hypothetical protein [Rhizobium sp. NZLR3b]
MAAVDDLAQSRSPPSVMKSHLPLQSITDPAHEMRQLQSSQWRNVMHGVKEQSAMDESGDREAL